MKPCPKCDAAADAYIAVAYAADGAAAEAAYDAARDAHGRGEHRRAVR